MAQDDNNPFAKFDLGEMVKAWSEHPMVKAVTENEFAQKLKNGELAEFDLSEITNSQKKNLESLRKLNETAAESFGQLALKQSELMSETLKGLKRYTENSADKPENSMQERFAEAETVFKKAVETMQQTGESIKATSGDMFEIMNERQKESLKELEALANKMKP